MNIEAAPISEGERCTGVGVLVAQRIEQNGLAIEPEEGMQWPFEAPTVLHLGLDREATWRLKVEAEGCWARDLLLESKAEPSDVRIQLWTPGHIEGILNIQEDSELPRQLGLRFESPRTLEPESASPVVSTTEIPCAVYLAEDGDQPRILCPLPSTRLDLRIEAEGFAPRYFWNLEVPAGGSFDLGHLDLERGASLAGWVVTSASPSTADKIQLELSPEILGASGSPIAERLGSRTLRTEATQRGFFQLRNIPPGDYALTARTAGHFSPGRIAPIEIDEGREYFLEKPITLEPLARLEVVVEPPVDPYSQQWQLELKRYRSISNLLEPISGRRPVATDGYWIEDALEEGHYVLSLYDSRGSRYHHRELEIRAELPLLQLAAPVVRLEGHLLKGEKPMEAILWFQGNGVEIRFEANEEGFFEGYLPQEDHSWRVKVALAERENALYVDRDKVRIEPMEDFAYVAIRLPDTRIHGTVVDTNGQAVFPSLITIYDDQGPELQVRGDKNGEFEALGLDPGRKKIRAEAENLLDSGFLSLDLDEDRNDEPLELEVHPMTVTSLRIWAASGPVPGTLVHFSLPENPIFAREGVTGPSGKLSLRLPYAETTTEVDLLLLPPGFARRILRISIPPGDGYTLDLPVQPGGQLTVDLEHSRYIFHDGVRVPLYQLIGPPDRGKLRGLDPTRGTMTLEVEAGEYMACPTHRVTDECAAGFLPLGGALPLDAQPVEKEPPAERQTSI